MPVARGGGDGGRGGSGSDSTSLLSDKDKYTRSFSSWGDSWCAGAVSRSIGSRSICSRSCVFGGEYDNGVDRRDGATSSLDPAPVKLVAGDSGGNRDVVLLSTSQ